MTSRKSLSRNYKTEEIKTKKARRRDFSNYLNSPTSSDVTIPKGTKIYTNMSSLVGRRFSYSTTENVVIPAGRTRAYASIIPNFTDTTYTAGVGSLTLHDFPSSVTALVYCVNPKEIPVQFGYETDDAYRVRIIKQIRVTSSGTSEAMRFAALSSSGVRDVSITQLPYGMGSVEIVIVPDQNGDVNQIVANATAAIEAVRPSGIRLFIKTPTTQAVDINVSLIVPVVTSSQLIETIVKRATTGVTRYLNSLLPGKPLVYNRLVSTIIDSSDSVKDVVINNLKVNGTEILRRNYQPGANEQLTPGNIRVSLATP